VVGRDRRLTNADYFLFGKFSLGAAFGAFLRKPSKASSGHVACRLEISAVIHPDGQHSNIFHFPPYVFSASEKKYS